MFALKNNIAAYRNGWGYPVERCGTHNSRFNRDAARHVATKTLPALNSAVRFNRDAARHVATKKNPRKPV